VPTLPILRYPSPIIRKRSSPVTSTDGKLQHAIDNMVMTMYAAAGVGLAAPQIGLLKRVIVLDPQDTKSSRLLTLLNPEIVAAEGRIVDQEGCLCIPDVREGVTRFNRVVVTGYDRSGKEVVVEGSGLLARVLQHEIDHLDGILFIDRLSAAKRKRLEHRLATASSRRSPLL
jgi:peptide deformylase